MLQKYSGVRRIHALYRRALRKFPQRLSLWISYISFCKACHSNKVLSRIFVQALKLHPLQSEIWIRAANWEYDENQNMNAARALLQKALRILKDDKNIWMQYFRLELLYRKKLSDRFALMGVDADDLTAQKTPADKQDEDDDDADEIMTIGGNRNERQEAESDEEADDTVNAIQEETESVSPTAGTSMKNPFFAGKILSILVHSASQLFPDDLDLLLDFWSIYRQFPDTGHLQQEIYDLIRKNFEPLPPQARGFLSRIPLLECTSVEASQDFFGPYGEAKALFDEDVLQCSETAMYAEYSAFFHQLLARCADHSCCAVIVADLIKVYEQAQMADALDESLCQEWSATLTSIGRPEEALSVLRVGLEKFPENLRLLESYFQVQLLSLAPSSPSGQELEKITLALGTLLGTALSQANEIPSLLSIWNLLKRFFLLSNSSFEIVKKYLTKILVHNPSDVQSIKQDALQFSIITFGLNEGRQLFSEARGFPPTQVEFYQDMIQIELAQPKPDHKRITGLFEEAVLEKEASQHPDLFIQYCQQELQNQDFAKIQAIYWKAKKILSVQEQERFDRMYEELTK